MNLYWYWPFLRREEIALAAGVLRRDDRLTVHTTPRAADPITAPVAGCRLDATLPEVRDRTEGTMGWLVSRGLTYAARARARRLALAGGEFDVAHLVYLNPFTDAVDLARLARRTPLVSSVHDVVPHMRRVPAPLERQLLMAQYRHAGTMIAHHESVRRRLLREFPIDPARVVVIPLPIPTVAARAGGAGERNGSRRTVLFFGTFRRNKGVAVLLDAIEALRGETEARFVFAGRGFPDVEELVVDAARRDDRIVTEIGFATAARKDELHATSDLIVLPYTSFASQSAVLQDAYAHRLPLVVSDVGALGETVRADRTGWVVPPERADELAATLLGALRDDEARRAAAAAADDVARARTPEVVGAELRALYERVAGRPLPSGY